MAESATSVGSLTFFGLFAMFSLSRPTCSERFQRDHRPHLACPLHPQTSYWLGDANEMVAINTILIIVNGGPPVIATTGRSGNLFAEKGGELAARSTKVPLTTSVIG